MKNEEFKKQMKKIRPSDELIEKTIENIKNVNKVKNSNKVKKLIAGTAAALTLSVGSVGAYIAVTGNTQILEKIGINLSQKYEENEQIITEENSSISKFSAEGIEATLKSAAIDNGSLVMQIDLKVDEKFDDKEFDLKIEDVNVFVPSRNSSWGELIISEIDNMQKMEDGTYRMFKYVAIEDAVTAGIGIWGDSFYEDEFVNCTVKFGSLIDKEGNILINNKNDDWKFEFKLNKPENLNEDMHDPEQVIQKIHYKNVEVNVNSIQKSTFGNNIIINAIQRNIDINKINDIQKIDFIVKDLNGNKINIISRTQNITMDDYKNGSMRTVCLEAIRLTVDDTTENAEYKIEIVETTKPIVSMEELKALNELLLIPFKNGESVLSIDGIEQIREILDKKGLEYYIDEYGVYRIDKTDSEIYETNIIGNEVKNEIENSINTEPEDEMLTPSEQDAISPELNDNSSLNQLQQNTNNLNNNTDIDVLDLGKQKYEEARNSYDKLNFDSTVAFVNENLEYYKITNINEVKEVYTKNTFSEFCNRAQIIEKNGSYYGRGPAGGGDISYLGYELKVDEIKDNKITFSVVKKYIANEDEYGLDLEQVKDIRIENETFIIVKENNDWKIDMEF